MAAVLGSPGAVGRQYEALDRLYDPDLDVNTELIALGVEPDGIPAGETAH